MKHNRHIKWIVGASSLTLLGAIGLSVQASPQQHNTDATQTMQNQFFGMDDDGFERHHHHEEWNDDGWNDDGQMMPGDDQMMMPGDGQMMPQGGMRSQAS